VLNPFGDGTRGGGENITPKGDRVRAGEAMRDHPYPTTAHARKKKSMIQLAGKRVNHKVPGSSSDARSSITERMRRLIRHTSSRRALNNHARSRRPFAIPVERNEGEPLGGVGAKRRNGRANCFPE